MRSTVKHAKLRGLAMRRGVDYTWDKSSVWDVPSRRRVGVVIVQKIKKEN